MRYRKAITCLVTGFIFLLWWMYYVSQPSFEQAEQLYQKGEEARAERTMKEWTRACFESNTDERQYKTTDTIIECFREAAYLFSNRVTFDTSSGLALLSLKEPGCTGDETEKAWHVLIMCGQHGRELVTSEVCLDLLYELLFSGAELHGVSWSIMPVLNPEGRKIVESDIEENGCWRWNANKVDLNRNFPSWVNREKRGEETNPETNPGLYPGSEKETRSMMDVLTRTDLRFDMIVNVHSGTEAVAIPYECCAMTKHPLYQEMVRAAQFAKLPMYEDPGELGRDAHEHLKRWLHKLPVGQSSHTTILYESIGTLVDYAVGVVRIPVGYTVEIYGVENQVVKIIEGEDASEGKICFSRFNPAPGAQLDRVVRIWSRYLSDLGHVWKQILKK